MPFDGFLNSSVASCHKGRPPFMFPAFSGGTTRKSSTAIYDVLADHADPRRLRRRHPGPRRTPTTA